MSYLPSEAEQEELLSALAAIISARGATGFLTAPIVIPHRRFLPDAWNGDFASVQVLLRRLMLYAGLDLGADLHVYDRDKAIYHHEDAIAWFAGIEKGRCRFGVDVDQLEDPQILIAALCHEIAHAYREHYRLRQDDRDREERLTDLTTVYLGFGILNANASDRFLQSGYMEGNMAFTETSFTCAGYLSAQAMSFLLAAQIVARDLPQSRRKALARELETNQAEYLNRAIRHLEKRRPELLARLGLPSGLGPQEEADLERFTRPLGGSEGRISVQPDPDLFEKDGPPNKDHTVFALREGPRNPIIIIMLAGAFGSWIGTLFTWGWEGTSPLLLAGVVVLAGLALSTRGRRRYRCTDFECRTVIPPEATVCPGCGCRVGGRIRSKREIYAGEE